MLVKQGPLGPLLSPCAQVRGGYGDPPPVVAIPMTLPLTLAQRGPSLTFPTQLPENPIGSTSVLSSAGPAAVMATLPMRPAVTDAWSASSQR